MRRFFVILVLLAALTGPAAHAAHTRAQLILGADSVASGSTLLAGVRLQMEPGWHTYWKNPGAAGEATEIKWELPPGITAGEIQWPLPGKIPPLDITTYGYENEVILLVPLSLDKSVHEGPLDISAKVSWLECKESCIPASATVQAVLMVAKTNSPSSSQPLLEAWQSRVPPAATNFSAYAWWEKPAAGDTRAINFQWSGSASRADFFPADSNNFEVQGETETLAAPAGQIHLRKLIKKYSGGWPTNIAGIFVSTNGSVAATVNIGNTPEQPVVGGTVASSPAQSLWRMLIYAFIGGLILNVMPCVLPVIALKILGFVNETRSSPRHVRLLGMIYSLGVLVSFLVLAGIVIAVKSADHKAAWGMQFGNPIFLVCLVTLVTLVTLNLFGVFEINLSGGAMNVASSLSSKNGAPGAFFNGMLATALATPCTAPILGSALGFAFTQPPWTLTLVFLFIGLGLSSPYLILSWNPAWLKFLPKPGAWMEKFKIAMGFPMLIATVWLFNIAASTYGKSVLWLGIFLVTLAAAAWTFGEFVQRGRKHKAAALVVCVLLLLGGYAYALEKELHWRNPVIETKSNGSIQESPDGIVWQPWNPEALLQARATGRPVLVDFTADWCLTCQVNKKTSIEIPAVREKLKAINAIALLADYTHTPDAITAELNHFGRAGVPLVLIYPASQGEKPIVLPEVLTPGIVLSALDRSIK